MSKAEYALLQDVIMDADFPDLDLALRRGRHVDRDDASWYSLLTDAQELLEPFYRRYGCELIHKTDGYFYLLPTGDKVSRKQLAATDMLVGQALALLYLDPAAVERGGVVTQEEVVSQLSAVLGSDALIGVFSPGKRKAKDERIAQRNVRQRVGEAMRRLAVLGFVELSEENAVRLRAALLRFAEPVRGLSEPAEALAKLVAQGEVALAPDEAAELDDADSDDAREGADVEPDRTTLVGVPAPELGVAAFREVAASGGSGSEDAAGAARSVYEGVDHVEVGADEAVANLSQPDDAAGYRALADDVAPRVASSDDSDADAAVANHSERDDSEVESSPADVDEARHSSDAAAAIQPERDAAAVGWEHADDVGPDAAAARAFADVDESDSAVLGVRGDDVAEASGVEEPSIGQFADDDDAYAESAMADTLAGIGAPDYESVEDAADGGEPERSAVVRKPRGPVDRDDLDWADILVPEPDAEDGS